MEQYVMPGTPYHSDGEITASCVLFKQKSEELSGLIEALTIAAQTLSLAVVFIDNSSDESLRVLIGDFPSAKYIKNPGGNTGFGRGHNLAFKHLAQHAAQYHLILNPDVEFEPDALSRALAFMEANPQCGLLAPKVFGRGGQQEFLCRRYPSVLDITLRGFAPKWLRRLFQDRLNHYEMRDVMNGHVVWDPPLVSGCFMLFRSEVLQKLGGFDPDFFLYFEDYDLSLRTAKIARIAYVPDVRITHYGGGASRKGFKHIWMFACSAVRFFNKHGWRWV